MSVSPEPLPSSTVILLRDEPDGAFSILMIERHGSVTFPGVHAFPGGVVEPGDADVFGVDLPSDQQWAPAGEGDTVDDARPYWVAAVRELFEEMGVLLAVEGERSRLLEGPLTPSHQGLRPRVLGGEPLGPLLVAHGLRPATHQLRYFSRWITPPRNPKRFDTRFLVGRMPAGQEVVVDGTETVSHEWLTATQALHDYHAGRIQLIPPTVRTLDDLSRFDSIDAVLADASRRVVRALCPDIDLGGDLPAMVYPSTTGSDVSPRRLVMRDGRWRPE